MLIRAFKQVARASGSVAPLIVAATFGVATPAFGHDETHQDARLDIVASPATVTRSTPAQTTFASYQVKVTSLETQSLKLLWFTATATTVDGSSPATFVSASGATCVTTNLEATSIKCTDIGIGVLPGLNSTLSFTVTFRTPTDGTQISLSGKSKTLDHYYEFQYQSASASTVIEAPSPDKVTSSVPPSGGTFSTGESAVATVADPFGVAVTVPPIPTSTSASVVESDVTSNINCTSLKNFVKCYRSDVTVPDVVFTAESGSYLTIVLRVDASNIKRKTKIRDALIQYDDGLNLHTIGQCASPTTPRTDGIPCIANAVHYSKKSMPGWTLDQKGDFEWTLLNLRNGRFSVF